ncbi:molybdenum cofactor guanylyltransferase MobA [Chimaeribacter californicus]|uniref:Molybdenum cofactor guanylyltransferase n=1 Tax=Chimaeribacter californicus TaxID=2060067 RepID=A0A2N5E0F6_9GAMM|nr:molybdenum cofactor guanylyltransferase MobA [Chimaeribacter californicus]PLR33691.1 molybdenum cofactor guanylyltransferase MobA [Chimaeribacter californicus]
MPTTITGVILCGGQATRMGGHDKGLLPFQGKPLYQHVAERLQPQVAHIILSANRNLEQYRQAYPTFADTFTGFAGPLAGILTGLQNSETDWAAFVPCDVPFLPDDLIERLWSARQEASVAYAHDGVRAHPTLCLLHRRMIAPLMQFLQQGDRKLMLFFEHAGAQAVYFQNHAQAFQNINTPAELQHLSPLDRTS